ncbi:MAG: hypothetical protein ACI9VR_002010 [Cognaticolwellia sp.]|jgi:hypothetical protein
MSPAPSRASQRFQTGGWLFGLVVLFAAVLPFVGDPFRGTPVGLALFCFFFPLLARREPLRGVLVNLFTLPQRGQRVMAALAVPFLAASIAVQFEVADPHPPWLGVFHRPEQLGLALLLAFPWILIIGWDSAPGGNLRRLTWAPLGLLLSALVLAGLSVISAPVQAWIDRVWPWGSVELFFTFAVLVGAMLVVVLDQRTWMRGPLWECRKQTPIAPAAVSVLGGFQVAAVFGLVLRELMLEPLLAAAVSTDGRVWQGIFGALPNMVVGTLTLVGLLFWIVPPFARHYTFLPWSGPVAKPGGWQPFVDAFKARSANLPDGPLFVVAAHGGGIQATVWTLAVLQRLGFQDGELVALKPVDGALDSSQHQARDAFWDRVVFMTGTSGGAVGLAHLFAACSESSALDKGLAKVGKGYLDTVVGCTLLPWKDRGLALAYRWRSQHRKSCTMRGLAGPMGAGELPMLILGASVLETGVPLSMAPLPVPRPSRLAKDAAYADVTSDLHEIDDGAWDVDVFTAARLASTFPFLTSMPQANNGSFKQHLGDLGYFDVNGTFFAFRWLEGVRRCLKAAGDPLAERHIELLSLDGFPQSSGGKMVSGTLAANLIGPLQLLTKVRANGQRLRNRELVDSLGDEQVSYREFRLDLSEAERQAQVVPLTWQLNQGELDRIQGYLDGHLDSMLSASDPGAKARL